MREGQEGDVDIKDVRKPVFQALLYFTYTDQLPEVHFNLASALANVGPAFAFASIGVRTERLARFIAGVVLRRFAHVLTSIAVLALKVLLLLPLLPRIAGAVGGVVDTGCRSEVIALSPTAHLQICFVYHVVDVSRRYIFYNSNPRHAQLSCS